MLCQRNPRPPPESRSRSIHRYLVKSCRGQSVRSALVEPWGLAGDRRWMLVDGKGVEVTARKHPRLLLVTPSYTSDGLVLERTDAAALRVPIPTARELVPVTHLEDARAGHPRRGRRLTPGSARSSDSRCGWSTSTTPPAATPTRSTRCEQRRGVVRGRLPPDPHERSLARRAQLLDTGRLDECPSADDPVPPQRRGRGRTGVGRGCLAPRSASARPSSAR